MLTSFYTVENSASHTIDKVQHFVHVKKKRTTTLLFSSFETFKTKHKRVI